MDLKVTENATGNGTYFVFIKDSAFLCCDSKIRNTGQANPSLYYFGSRVEAERAIKDFNKKNAPREQKVVDYFV